MRNKLNTVKQTYGWKMARLVSHLKNGQPGFRKWPLPAANRRLRRALRLKEAKLRRQAYREECLKREARRLAEQAAQILENSRRNHGN